MILVTRLVLCASRDLMCEINEYKRDGYIPEGPITANNSPGLTTPETSRRSTRFSLTTCNPRKINCTGRESSGHTNCNAELSTLQTLKCRIFRKESFSVNLTRPTFLNIKIFTQKIFTHLT